MIPCTALFTGILKLISTSRCIYDQGNILTSFPFYSMFFVIFHPKTKKEVNSLLYKQKHYKKLSGELCQGKKLVKDFQMFLQHPSPTFLFSLQSVYKTTSTVNLTTRNKLLQNKVIFRQSMQMKQNAHYSKKT